MYSESWPRSVAWQTSTTLRQHALVDIDARIQSHLNKKKQRAKARGTRARGLPNLLGKPAIIVLKLLRSQISLDDSSR
jgi:hypothetical protein